MAVRRVRLVVGVVITITTFSACVDEKRGRLFLTGVNAADGRFIGVVADYLPGTESGAELEINWRGADLDYGVEQIGAAKLGTGRSCLALPDSGRITIVAGNGELSTDARVRGVVRIRGSDTASTCTGAVIDDAVWPVARATTPTAHDAEPADGAGTDALADDAASKAGTDGGVDAKGE